MLKATGEGDEAGVLSLLLLRRCSPRWAGSLLYSRPLLTLLLPLLYYYFFPFLLEYLRLFFSFPACFSISVAGKCIRNTGMLHGLLFGMW